MAEHEERPPADWGDTLAKWTFIWSLLLAVLYVAAVAVFVL